MSRIALNSTELDPNDSVPVSQVLEHEDVTQITCLPYTMSPFSLLEQLRSSRQTIRASDSIRFDSDVKDQFVSDSWIVYVNFTADVWARWQHILS